jgi:hypothetical protein
METRTYTVTSLPAGTQFWGVKWNEIPEASVDTFLWEEGYSPKTIAQLAYSEGVGFFLRMTCEEENPKAEYRRYNDPVYKDSCMEFFCDFLGDGRYINLEMNINGTLLSYVGEGRHNRTPISELTGGAIFITKGWHQKGYWEILAQIPCEMLQRILGVETLPFTSGYTFRGNFYKCGDETPIPHYGMWNPVGTETPDFHRPEFFGTLVIE